MIDKDHVWSLMIEVGRSQDDGLPPGSTGAALFCYSSGHDEKNAVDEAVNVLRQAGMMPLEVTSYGSCAERIREGHVFEAKDLALIARAVEENAVIVASVMTFDD